MIDTLNTRPIRVREFWPVNGQNAYNTDLKLAAVAGTNAVGETSGTLRTAGASAQEVPGATDATDKNARQRAIGNGNPRLVAIDTLFMSGLLVTAANDGIEFFKLIPYELDRSFLVGVRPIWTHNTLAAITGRSVTWAAKHKVYTPAAASTKGKVGTLAAAATALDTTIGSQAVAAVTTLTLMRGNRGIIKAAKLGKLDWGWTWQVLATAITGFAGGEYVYLLGLEVDYVPRRVTGRRATRDPDETILGL